MATPSKLNLNELAASIVRCFPSLNLLEQRLSLDLYRLLAEGQPVRVGRSVIEPRRKEPEECPATEPTR